jgi:hypothetical protein
MIAKFGPSFAYSCLGFWVCAWFGFCYNTKYGIAIFAAAD